MSIIYKDNKAYDTSYDMYIDEFEDADEEEIKEYFKNMKQQYTVDTSKITKEDLESIKNSWRFNNEEVYFLKDETTWTLYDKNNNIIKQYQIPKDSVIKNIEIDNYVKIPELNKDMEVLFYQDDDDIEVTTSWIDENGNYGEKTEKQKKYKGSGPVIELSAEVNSLREKVEELIKDRDMYKKLYEDADSYIKIQTDEINELVQKLGYENYEEYINYNRSLVK